MSWFKKKESLKIPPVGDEQPRSTSPRPPSYRSQGSYGDSGASDMYSSRKTDDDQYGGSGEFNASSRFGTRSQAPGDQYSRGERNLDADRSELFSGYKPGESRGSGRFFDGPQGRKTPPPGEETQEDVEGIKQQTRWVKQESVNSTRNALRIAREAEETARNTMQRLGDQSEKIANTERHLDVAKGHSNRAEDYTDEIKKLNRSIFIPAVTFNKTGKRQAQEQKRQMRYEEERMEREQAMSDIQASHGRIGQSARDAEDATRGRFKTETDRQMQKQARSRFQFEATQSDDEMEDELDDNLDEIHNITKGLKALGTAMGQELEQQNSRLGRITEKTDNLGYKIDRNTDKLKRIH